MRTPYDPIIKILIASDSYLTRSGLRKILEFQTGLRILQEVSFDSVGRHDQPHLHEAVDLVLFDLDPKANDILGALNTIRKALSDIPILVLIDLADHELARRALALGANGVALKIQPPAVLIAAVRDLCQLPHAEATLHPVTVDNQKTTRKGFLKSDASNAESTRRIGRLTHREREIIRMVGLGLKNKDIAAHLSITDITVRHHLTSIFRKLEVSDRQKLLIIAYRFGLIELMSAETAG